MCEEPFKPEANCCTASVRECVCAPVRAHTRPCTSLGQKFCSDHLKAWEESCVREVTPELHCLDSYTTPKKKLSKISGRRDKCERGKRGACLCLENSSLLSPTSGKNVFFDSARAFVDLGRRRRFGAFFTSERRRRRRLTTQLSEREG